MSFEQGVLVRNGKVIGGISPDVLPLIGNVETVGTASKNDYSANTGVFINSLDLQLYGAISDISTDDILSPYPSGGENSNCALLDGYNVLTLIDELYPFIDANSTFAGVGHCATDGATAVKKVGVSGTVKDDSVIGIIFTNTNTATESEVKIQIMSGSGKQTYPIWTIEPDSRAYGVANYMSLYTVATITPSEGDPYKALKFIGSFAPDEDSGNLVELEYGVSTYAEFLEAYQKHKIVYCKASSGTDPAVGSKLRKAFMAYVNDDTTPTEVEFQYYRSISTHTLIDQVDEVHIYKLNSTSGWSYTTRKISLAVAVATNGGLTRAKSGNSVVLSVDGTVLRDKTLTGFEETVGKACTNPNGYTVGSYFKGKDGNFYEVTAAISSGATITVGTNCKQTDIATELSELNADIAGLITTENITVTFTSGRSSRVTSLADKVLISAELLGNALIVGADVDGGQKVGYSFMALNSSASVDTSVNGSKTVKVTYIS